MTIDFTGVTEPRKPRGFATLTKAQRSEIARKGGKAAHAKGTAHQFTSDEARSAGSRGGKAVAKKPGHMASIGRVGGRTRKGKTRKGNLPKTPVAVVES